MFLMISEVFVMKDNFLYCLIILDKSFLFLITTKVSSLINFRYLTITSTIKDDDNFIDIETDYSGCYWCLRRMLFTSDCDVMCDVSSFPLPHGRDNSKV